MLDNFAIKGVVAYDVKETVTGLSRLKLEIDIKKSNLNVRWVYDKWSYGRNSLHETRPWRT